MKNKEEGGQVRDTRASWDMQNPETREQPEDTDDAKLTNWKVKRRGWNKSTRGKMKNQNKVTIGLKVIKKTEDVFRDTLLLSVCFQFVSEDFAFVVEHIAFME